MARPVLILALLLTLSCATPQPPPARARDLVVGIVGQFTSLLEDDPVGAVIAAAVTEPLVRRTATEDLEPRLAIAVPSFSGGDLTLVEDATAPLGRLVARYRLREGARWHDDAPITAEDVRFAWDLDRAAPTGTLRRAMAERVERVDVIDERTVLFSYRAGERWDLYALAPRVMPRHLLERADAAARERYASHPVHAGPFRIAARSGGTIVLEAFSGHVLGPPRLARVVARSYPSRSALLDALVAGEVDVAPSPHLGAELAATLDRSLADRVRYTQSQAVAMLRFGPRFAHPSIRIAASLTVDRERIARSLFGGRVRVPASYLVAPLWAARETGVTQRLDRAAARASLEREGSRRGNFGIAELRGDRLIGTLLVPQGSYALAEAARDVAVDLALLGIAIDISERPLAEVEQRVQRGEFDLAVVIEQADDPVTASERYRGLVSPWYDVLAAAANASGERSDKRALYAEMQSLWSEAVPALPLFQLLKVDVVPQRMDGVRPASHSAPLTWNLGDWRPAR